jgi:hypothetical protein
MDREELLKELSEKIDKGELSRDEVVSRLHLGPAIQPHGNELTKRAFQFSLAKMLYVLGTIIVIIGIVAFVTQIWEDIGSSARIAVTLGLGILIAAIGSVLLRQRPGEAIGVIFHVIGGLLIPGGVTVTMHELADPGVASVSLWPLTIAFGIVLIFYLLLTVIHKHPILTFFAIANGTVFTYLLVEASFGDPPGDLYAYLTMVLSVSYLLFAYGFRDGWNKPLIGILRFLGVSGFLGSAFSQVFDSVPWQLLYFIIVIGGVTLSVYLRSRTILVISSFFLVCHISYITGEHFADSLGWPVTLVILGFVFLAVGYASFTISRKYI